MIDADEDIDLHYTCFVEIDNHLIELDGSQAKEPIDHGELDPELNFLKNSVKIIKRMMEQDPTNTNFNLIALAPTQQ